MKFSLIERTFVAAGSLALVAGLSISSMGIVNAARILASKGCNSANACIKYTNGGSGPGMEGINTGSGGANAFGVLGQSSGTDGVHGTSTHAGSSGVAGIMTGTSANNGNGVYGQSSDSSGKYGAIYAAAYNAATYLFQGFNFSTGNNCKIDPNANLACTGTLIGNRGSGNGNGFAVEGIQSGDGGSAVAGIANGTETGVFAQSADSTGNFDALAAFGTNAATYLFDAVNEANSTNCTIDPKANLSCSGSINGDRLQVAQRTAANRRVLAYATESATATIEDVGTARMSDGVANVTIPRDFAATMEPGSAYYVFLTPKGDTRGLYIANEYERGFTVRENERGHSSVLFDYRIVAHPLGAAGDRLPPAPPHRELRPPSRRR